MDELARLHWVALRLLPLEGEVRGWLRAHARSLNAADIDDLIQEAFARIWTADIGKITNARAYFYTVVRHLLAEQARRARIVPLERMGEIEALRIISEEPGPERSVGARQELAWLARVIAQLPAQCRRAFELRKFQGMSQREIAKAMDISEGTVEKHLAKALLRIKDVYGTATAVDTADGTPVERADHDRSKR